MVKSEHLLCYDLSCHQAMPYTNYTNYLTKLAVTKMMQILISVYYFSNEVIHSSKTPQKQHKNSAFGYSHCILIPSKPQNHGVYMLITLSR